MPFSAPNFDFSMYRDNSVQNLRLFLLNYSQVNELSATGTIEWNLYNELETFRSPGAWRGSIEPSIRWCEGEQGPGDLGFDPTEAKRRRPKRKRVENKYIVTSCP